MPVNVSTKQWSARGERREMRQELRDVLEKHSVHLKTDALGKNQCQTIKQIIEKGTQTELITSLKEVMKNYGVVPVKSTRGITFKQYAKTETIPSSTESSEADADADVEEEEEEEEESKEEAPKEAFGKHKDPHKDLPHMEHEEGEGPAEAGKAEQEHDTEYERVKEMAHVVEELKKQLAQEREEKEQLKARNEALTTHGKALRDKLLSRTEGAQPAVGAQPVGEPPVLKPSVEKKPVITEAEQLTSFSVEESSGSFGSTQSIVIRADTSNVTEVDKTNAKEVQANEGALKQEVGAKKDQQHHGRNPSIRTTLHLINMSNILAQLRIKTKHSECVKVKPYYHKPDWRALRLIDPFQ